MFARAVTIPRRFEAEKVGDSARRAEQHPTEDDGVKIIRRAFDAFHYKTVNRVFADEHCRAESRRDQNIFPCLLAFQTDVAD